MFDPFDRNKSSFANVFNDATAASYYRDQKKLGDREEALRRAQGRTEELQKRQSAHEVNMANEYGAPSQVDRSWSSNSLGSIAKLAEGLFTTYMSTRTPKPDPVQNSLNEMRKYTSNSSSDNLWRPT